MAEDKNNPFAVRMDQEDKDKLLQMIQESGKNNKEFMNVLLSAYELNKVKVDIPEATESIVNLQRQTQLINDYFINMSKQIRTTKESLDLQFIKELEIYKNRIETFKLENEKISNDFNDLTEAFNSICSENEELKKKLESKDKLADQFSESIKDKTSLVEEYKGKNDMLLSNLKQFEKYAEQLEATKELLANSQAKNFDLDNIIKNKDNNISKINEMLETLKSDNEKSILELIKKHKEETENVKAMAEFEKKQEILELKQLEQDKVQKVQEESNNKINEYQSKYKTLLEELE